MPLYISKNLMLMTPKTAVLVLATVMLTAACSGDKGEKQAKALLEKAETERKTGQYDMALRTIDSMRRTFPEAIEARKEGLKLYQNVALEQAQSDLARTDSLLQTAKREYEQAKSETEAARRELRATPEELQNVTLLKVRLDSLQVRFDVQCAKIKYIHKKQKE